MNRASRLSSIVWLIAALAVGRAAAQSAVPVVYGGGPSAPAATGAVADTFTRTALLEPVVLSATRTERPLSRLPLPVILIPEAQIRQMGAMRLGEVLGEIPGVALVQNQFGQGLQLQGFDPDYTLILVDGEPLVGRTAGVLQLSRLSVHDIARIEVVKGPSSSLFGSEALAGVVNVITRPVTAPLSLGARARTGSNATSDLTLDAAGRQGRLWGRVLVNRFASGGYDLQPAVAGPTIGSNQAYTLQGKLGYDLSGRTQLSLSTRYLVERQQTTYPFGTGQADVGARIVDWSVLPTVVHYLRPSIRWRTSVYAARYATTDDWRQGDQQVDANRFEQTFVRPEMQLDFGHGTQRIYTVGVGGTLESVDANRYDARQSFRTLYTFAQADLALTEWLGVVAGARLDAHSLFRARLSPKLAVRADLGPAWQIRAAVGAGFKAPDFRQLYLNFTNLSAAYSVFGTQQAGALLAAAQAAGQLAALYVDPTRLAELRPERSVAYQLSATWRHADRLTLTFGGFWHEVTDLIEFLPVAFRTNGQQVFSYTNLGRIRIRGAEVDVQWQAAPGLQLSAGYQLLLTEDRDVVAGIATQSVFQSTSRLTEREYLGLFNRSRHSGTLKAFYQHPRSGTGASARLILRGPFGLADGNGNGVYDTEDPSVPGHALLNLSLTQRLSFIGLPDAELQVGADNALDFTAPDSLPGLPGRLWFVAFNYRFSRTDA